VFHEGRVGGEPFWLFHKWQCMHCSEAPCAKACPVEAIEVHPEGPVVIRPDKCIGCRYCIEACPYNVPRYDPVTNKVYKCTMCVDRIQNGLAPACVEACPQEALTFGHRKTLIKTAHERIRSNPKKYVDHVYGEKEVGGTSWMYLSSVPFDQVGFNTDLQQHPILDNTKSFLGFVPMVLGIWPALFMGFHLLATGKKGKAEAQNSNNRGEGHEE